MTQNLTREETAQALQKAEDILVITHKNPDGDAIGSALAICTALRSLGKRCNATWTGELTRSYDLITAGYEDMDFTPRFILAVDIAATHLLPENTQQYARCVDLCIDHHGTNQGYAAATHVEADSASCCEILLALLDLMGVEITPYLGACIYVGLSTDTGCFKYSNTNADTYRTAARLSELGVDIPRINQSFFEQKTLARVQVERMALNGMEMTCGGKICFITITREMMDSTRCLESDVEGIAGLPREIEGVEAGVTLREQKNGNFKISVRTKTLDASRICAVFGGGGHLRASGCEISGTPFDIKVALVAAIKQELERIS